MLEPQVNHDFRTEGPASPMRRVLGFPPYQITYLKIKQKMYLPIILLIQSHFHLVEQLENLDKIFFMNNIANSSLSPASSTFLVGRDHFPQQNS